LLLINSNNNEYFIIVYGRRQVSTMT